MDSTSDKKIKTAAVFGATGLVGEYVVRFLLENPAYSEVKVFVRKEMPWTCPQLKVITTQFEDFNVIEDELNVDEVFCCIGSTRRKLGQFQSFVNIDYDLPVHIAQIALKHNVSGFYVVSAQGADKRSHNYYLRTKGRLEEYLIKTGFNRLSILRPSILLGNRREFRISESLAALFSQIISPFLQGSAKRYKCIPAEYVARAMVRIANGKYTKQVFESEELGIIGKL
jgi:uncharacterized protein YbjT (DUF2867 family)